MQLILYHKVEKPLVLPLSYHHIIHSIIFQTLEKVDPAYSRFMHDEGYIEKTRNFKLFTFGLLQGRYTIRDRNIIFTEDVTFEIRSVDSRMLQLLQQGFLEHGITYGEDTYTQVSVTLRNEIITSEELLIRMGSPICLYSTDESTKKTTFYSPEDESFLERLQENFRRKYEAYTGVLPQEDIFVELKSIHPKDKYVTRYKGFYINAWKGTYILRGKCEYLNFLFQTGLGSKNSQGFGMFEVVSYL